MQTFSTLPAAEGFRMPAEYEPHRGCVMIWPVRPGSWLYGGRDAQPAFAQAARAIAESETVWMLAGPADTGAVQAEFAGDENIHVLTIETDDAWARDVGPTCVVDDHGTVRGVEKDGTLYTHPTSWDVYGVIALDDLLAGSTDFTPLNFAE